MHSRGLIWDTFAAYIPNLRMSGPNNAVGTCPFHQDDHPSFAFNIWSGQWICYAGNCGLAGPLERFLDLVGKSREEIEAIISPIKRSIIHHREKSRLAWLLKFLEDPYLGECILPESVLGVYDYKPMPLVDAGFSPKVLRTFKIGFDKRLKRMTFPIRDAYGNLLGISGRTVIGEYPKYKVYKGGRVSQYGWIAGDFGKGFDSVYNDYVIKSRNHVWNFHNVRKIVERTEEPLIVTEGYKACMWVVQCGFKCAVAIMGSVQLSRNQSDILKGLSNPIVLFLDYDDAGIQGTLSIGKELSKVNRNIYVAQYPKDTIKPGEPDGLSIAQTIAAIEGRVRWRKWERSIQSLAKDSERV